MHEQPTRIHSGHRIRNIILTAVISPFALILALLVVSFVMSIFSRSDRIKQGDYSLQGTSAPATTEYTNAQKILTEGTNNYFLGSKEPVLTIVQFSDFACPFCKASFPGIREMGLKYNDKVKIIFRDWPGHTYSLPLATGAYCAGEQGKFWEMHDKLFQNQSDTFGSDKNQIAVLAQQLGIYNEQFQKCFDSKKYIPQIRQNFVDSETLGVKGTPTWFFNGQKVEGAISSDTLEQIIQEFLK